MLKEAVEALKEAGGHVHRGLVSSIEAVEALKEAVGHVPYTQ